ncbi:MAG TPA: TadE/TadG family type IV pilus assembly protein, partial [Ardenticatenaceae bacterium]
MNDAPQPQRSRFRLALQRLWKRDKERSRGQSLVEFALVVPVLLMMIFGIIDMARVVQAQVTVNNAARQAVRLAVTGHRDRDPNTNQYIPRNYSIFQRAYQGLGGLPLR